MGEVRDFVMDEPLSDNHEHQNGFSSLEQRRRELTYREFTGYAGADLTTAAGPEGTGELDDERFFALWSFARTTGYGQATESACAELLGLDYRADGAEEITNALRDYAAERSAETIYDELLRAAGIRWGLNDCCWDSPTKLEYFDGSEHPDAYLQMLRYDDVLAVSQRDQVRRWEGVFDRPLQRLSDLDDALDAYTEKAREGGKLGGMKSAQPYQRRIDFERSSYADAERAFAALMQGREPELKPLHDYLFHRFVQRAREFGLPVQLHTGYLAGNWGHPGQGDPELLVPIFQRYRSVRFDVFHAGWPYCEVLGAIAKAFPNVYPDMCWAWAMNPVQMERVLIEWLGAVPHNKICAFGGDTGTPFCTLGYALQARRGIARALRAWTESGGWDQATAAAVARRIMHENGRELYRMD